LVRQFGLWHNHHLEDLMPSSTSFQSKYLTPGAPNAIVGAERFAVAGELYRLQDQFRMGATAPQAQARTNDARRGRALARGQNRTPAGGALTSDFAAIDSL
jgi:hypothetical protein